MVADIADETWFEDKSINHSDFTFLACHVDDEEDEGFTSEWKGTEPDLPRDETASELVSEDPGNHESFTVQHLIENDVSHALVHKHSKELGVKSWDFEGWLCNSGQGYNSESSQQSRSSATTLQREQERLLLRQFFFDRPCAVGAEGDRSDTVTLQEQHTALGRVLSTIFAQHQLDTTCTPSPSWRGLTQRMRHINWSRFPGGRLWLPVHSVVKKLVDHTLFIGSFMLLTLYALFGPDMFALWGGTELELTFIVANTVVFLLYCIELVLHVVGKKSYIFTIVFALDIISLVSMFNDTWFIQGVILPKDDQTSQLARSSRLTRLARIARIARVTRMVPALMAACMKQKMRLAKRILLRRLWRTFLFLDTDHDGYIGVFDLKFFYASILLRCPGMLKAKPIHLLEADLPLILSVQSNYTELSFDDFNRIFATSLLGKDLLRFHLDDLERDDGVWTLIRKVSDRTSLKLCIGILVLLIMLKLVSETANDASAQQGLAQLDVIAQAEHAAGNRNITTYLCEQIAHYEEFHNVLFLVLDGWLHWEDSQCVSPPRALPTSTLADMLSAKFISSGLREDEALQICWPNADKCVLEAARSVVLIDQTVTYRTAAAAALMSTVTVIVLLLLFIIVLNMKISQFSKALLQPLRALLDDMVVLSNLELAEVDEELPADVIKVGRNEAAEELQHLQDSFKTMRNAIRSWSKYVPPAVVQGLFRAGLEAKIGVVKCRATILFCDIEDFENSCRGLAPEEVLDLLSTVTGVVADIIHRNEGTLLEFIGDEVLAVFNTPKQITQHAYSGVLTALQIHSDLRNRPYRTENGREIPIQCRCGVHTGPIFAGNIGSHQRMKYGLLGDSINLTARLKGLNSRYRTETLVSESTVAEARQHLPFRPIDLVAVKGKKEPTVVYESFPPSLVGKAKAATRHAEAFRLYMARSFLEAMEAFEAVRDSVEAVDGSSDVPSRMLIKRCSAYLETPPPADWDGVERLAKKAFGAEATSGPGAGGADSPPATLPEEEPDSEPRARVPPGGQEVVSTL